MTRDEESGAPQFTAHEMKGMGTALKNGVFKVTIDDVNMYLRAHFFRAEQRPRLSTKRVWQWRYRTRYGNWKISPYLYTESEVRQNWTWNGAEFEQHAGPFEVPK